MIQITAIDIVTNTHLNWQEAVELRASVPTYDLGDIAESAIRWARMRGYLLPGEEAFKAVATALLAAYRSTK